MIAIGGYINIGIVFYETIHLPNAFRQLADYLAEKEMSITKVKYSKDSDGEIGIEQSIKRTSSKMITFQVIIQSLNCRGRS